MFLDENYWSLNSFKKDKANHLKASELKIFTDEDNGKVLTVGGQTIQSYGTFGSKVDIAFKEAEGIYFASEADYEFSSVGTSTLLFDPSGFDLVVAIDSSYGITVIDDAANMAIDGTPVHADLRTIPVANNKVPLVLCFDNAK